MTTKFDFGLIGFSLISIGLLFLSNSITPNSPGLLTRQENIVELFFEFSIHFLIAPTKLCP